MSDAISLRPPVYVRQKGGVTIRFTDADVFANWLNDLCSAAASGDPDAIGADSLQWLDAILQKIEKAIDSGAECISPEVYHGLPAPADAPISINQAPPATIGKAPKSDQTYLDFAQNLYRMVDPVERQGRAARKRAGGQAQLAYAAAGF